MAKAKKKEHIPEIQSENATVNLYDFAQTLVRGFELTPFHEAYYRVLDAFATGKIKRLIVTVPPQHGKSLGSSILLPAYMLGLNPDLRIAIASYSSALANRFNKRVQRTIDSKEYGELFPNTAIKSLREKSDYVRTADRAEVKGRDGEIMSVGREGPLTGNQVDIFILDDLYKDAMEANSPTIRENCLDWYISVVRTRMHNYSAELIVFTRWHHEDLIGTIMGTENVTPLETWSQLDSHPPEQWLLLNFEAIKESPPTEIDPRTAGKPLWPQRHGAELLSGKRRFDIGRFECMYQGHPSAKDGLLYGNNFTTYQILPPDIVRYANYTDTADTGEDFLCSVCYAVDKQGVIYLTDIVYSQEPMERTEEMVAEMLALIPESDVLVESNNGGRGFARAISRRAPNIAVAWFYQSANKEARILSNSSTVMRNICMPYDWQQRWELFARHITSYRRQFRSNRWHDAADVLTGIIERECTKSLNKKIKATTFIK